MRRTYFCPFNVKPPKDSLNGWGKPEKGRYHASAEEGSKPSCCAVSARLYPYPSPLPLDFS
jgi:hypothetical protein